jgi:hypothetical protein
MSGPIHVNTERERIKLSKYLSQGMSKHFSTFSQLLSTAETKKHNCAMICMNIYQPFLGVWS